MGAKYTKPAIALENAVETNKLSPDARRYLIHILARDFRVQLAFKHMDGALPAHEAASFAALDKLIFNLEAAVEASATGVEGKIHLLRGMITRLGILPV